MERVIHDAILRGLLWLPYQAVPDLDHLKRTLVYQPRKKDGEIQVPVPLFIDNPEGQKIGVPIRWGIENYGRFVNVVDMASDGEEFATPVDEISMPDHDHPAVTEHERQRQFMKDVLTAAHGQNRFLARAPTGTGKTVVSAGAAAVLRRKTLVLTHLTRINKQWADTFHKIIGIPRSRIGSVADGKVDYKDKDVVIGTYQTVSLRPFRFSEDFYTGFGTVICDEAHKCGAPAFSKAIWQFPARYVWGMTATDKRRDGGDSVFKAHLGDVSVSSEQEALPIQIWPRWYTTRRKLWGDTHGARITCLSRDMDRSVYIASLVLKMYRAGRQTLVVSERILHLQVLIKLLSQIGVPLGAMGQYTADIIVHTIDGEKKQKQKQADLEDILQSSQLIFATYGMIKEGIDLPRLDAGIDVTPQSSATQLIGRLRRPHPGKKQPVIWVTMVDVECNRSLRYYESRVREYNESGAEVVQP